MNAAAEPIDHHSHGYDGGLWVDTGAAVEMAFTAHATGRFPVQIHARGGSGYTHGAPLVYIEVHPR